MIPVPRPPSMHASRIATQSTHRYKRWYKLYREERQHEQTAPTEMRHPSRQDATHQGNEPRSHPCTGPPETGQLPGETRRHHDKARQANGTMTARKHAEPRTTRPDGHGTNRRGADSRRSYWAQRVRRHADRERRHGQHAMAFLRRFHDDERKSARNG